MRTGLGAFPFGGFHWFGLPSHEVFFSFGPVVCFCGCSGNRLAHVSVSC